MGPTFVRMTSEKTGADIVDVIKAFMIVRDAFGLKPLWDGIESLDNKVAASVQLRALYKTSRLAERETYWLLTRLGRDISAQKDSDTFAKGISDLKKKIETILPKDSVEALKQRRKSWVNDGLPQNLANDISLLPFLGAGFDIIKTADLLKADMTKVAQVYFAVGASFQLENLRAKASLLPQDNVNIATAINGVVDSLYSVQADLTARIVRDIGKTSVTESVVANWIEKFCPRAAVVLDKISSIDRMGGTGDLAGLVVIEQNLRQLL